MLLNRVKNKRWKRGKTSRYLLHSRLSCVLQSVGPATLCDHSPAFNGRHGLCPDDHLPQQRAVGWEQDAAAGQPPQRRHRAAAKVKRSAPWWRRRWWWNLPPEREDAGTCARTNNFLFRFSKVKRNICGLHLQPLPLCCTGQPWEDSFAELLSLWSTFWIEEGWRRWLALKPQFGKRRAVLQTLGLREFELR